MTTVEPHNVKRTQSGPYN